MKSPKKEKIIIAVAIVFIVVAVLFVFGRNMSVKSDKIRRTDSTVMPEATGTSNEIRRTTIVSQDFVNTSDTISKVGIVFVRASYMQDVHLTLELLEGDKVLASNSINVTKIEEQHRTYVTPASKLTGMKGKTLTLKIYPTDKEDTGMKIMVASNIADSSYKFGNVTYDGSLCFSVTE